MIPLTCPLSGYRTKFRIRFAKWLFANKFITLKKNHNRRLVGFGEMLLFNFKKILIVANVFLVSIFFVGFEKIFGREKVLRKQR